MRESLKSFEEDKQRPFKSEVDLYLVEEKFFKDLSACKLISERRNFEKDEDNRINLKIFKVFSIFKCMLRERENLTKSFDDSNDVELEK